MKIVEPSIELINWTSLGHELIEICGRTCYKSEAQITPISAKAFVKKIIDLGHDSVLEHASATFKIIADRGFTHELVRHRLASYSQESTRFCNYSKDKFGSEISVIKPLDLTIDQSIWWSNACKHAEANYFEMLRHGCKPEIARSVLPICLKTEIVITANFREWRHILVLRTSMKAHPMMRHVMGMIQKKLIEVSEVCFND